MDYNVTAKRNQRFRASDPNYKSRNKKSASLRLSQPPTAVVDHATNCVLRRSFDRLTFTKTNLNKYKKKTKFNYLEIQMKATDIEKC